jgi:hypothetical protein
MARAATADANQGFHEADSSTVLQRALAHCRRGEWERGLAYLSTLTDGNGGGPEMPGLYYSYLGYAVALCQRQIREGVRLCEHAVKVEFYQPENYLNLARVYLLADQRRKAAQVLARGLAIDPEHKGLRNLAKHMGRRRRPVIPFLSRGSFLNRILGRLRHDLSRGSR